MRSAPVRPAALLRTARPRQWIKNLLVFAAPAAAGALLRPATAAAATWAFLAFTAAAIGTYFVNDAADAQADRRHPAKKLRPVAAGLLSRRAARIIGGATAAAALALAAMAGWPLVGCVLGYLVLTGAYNAGLKHVPVLEVLVVAAGFVVRTAGGAAATSVPVSPWFMLVTLFGALYLVTAKRIGEQNRSPTEAPRRVLADYPAIWLQQILTMALTGSVLAYATWALQYPGRDVVLPLLASSVLPFIAALLRYHLLVTRGDGETPEGLLTSDPFLLAAGGLWCACAGGAIYLG